MDEELTDRLSAALDLIEQVGPLLISGSPNRQQIVDLLRKWAQQETGTGAEMERGNLAEALLKGVGEPVDIR